MRSFLFIGCSLLSLSLASAAVAAGTAQDGEDGAAMSAGEVVAAGAAQGMREAGQAAEAAAECLPKNRASLDHFDAGSAALTPAMQDALEAIAQAALAEPECGLVLRAFASPEGSYEHNQRLARARGESVADALRERGIEDERIHFVLAGVTDAFGEGDPGANRLVTVVPSRGVGVRCSALGRESPARGAPTLSFVYDATATALSRPARRQIDEFVERVGESGCAIDVTAYHNGDPDPARRESHRTIAGERAEVAEDYLVEAGIESGRILARGTLSWEFGSEPEANRRVVIQVR